MGTESIATHVFVATKIANYRERHRGRYPARIFASHDAFIDLIENAPTLIAREDGGHAIFGVPIVYFGTNDPMGIYLSDEEET